MALHPGVSQLMDAETVTGAATVYGTKWVRAGGAEAFAVWVLLTDETTPKVDVFLDITPFGPATISDADSTDTGSYTSVQIVDDLATADVLQRYTSETMENGDNELDYPFTRCRARVVGDATNGACNVSVWLGYAEENR